MYWDPSHGIQPTVENFDDVVPLLTWINLNTRWICDHIHWVVWDEIAFYSLPKSSRATVDVDGSVIISPNTLLDMWLLIHDGIKVKILFINKKGPQAVAYPTKEVNQSQAKPSLTFCGGFAKLGLTSYVE